MLADTHLPLHLAQLVSLDLLPEGWVKEQGGGTVVNQAGGLLQSLQVCQLQDRRGARLQHTPLTEPGNKLSTTLQCCSNGGNWGNPLLYSLSSAGQ